MDAAPSLDRLQRVRERLDRLRALDGDLRVFGADPRDGHGHGYREYPPLGEDGVAALEAEHGVTLPAELHAFLAVVHGGGPGPGYGLDVWANPGACARPFPYGPDHARAWRAEVAAGRNVGLDLEDSTDDGAWPPGSGFVACAHQGCGVYDALIVTGPARGTMWCCDMAWRPYLDDTGAPLSFLAWYEAWLDAALAAVAPR